MLDFSCICNGNPMNQNTLKKNRKKKKKAKDDGICGRI